MTARAEIRAGGLRLSKNPEGFPTKGLQSAARRICVPVAHKFHTCSLSSIFSHAHVARENDFTFLPPAGGKLCEAFLTRCSRPHGDSCGRLFVAAGDRGLCPIARPGLDVRTGMW